MQNKKKNKKLTEGEGFTLAQEQPLGLSIGALLGVPQKEVALQRQRAGRGGKTVTLVILPQDYKGDTTALAKELRKGLGCGSTIEDGKIVLQGDIADRAEAWFAKKGVTKITKSI